MEPSSNPSPSFELPQPQRHEANQPADSGEIAPALERGLEISAQPGSGAPAGVQPVLQPDPLVVPSQSISPAPVAQPQPLGTMTPQAASDDDLIEKEWVEKAKDIVEKTRTDPRRQNVEIHRFKADYMKKRYNKDIKVIDE